MRSEQRLVGGAQRADLLALAAAAFHADDVQAGEPRAVADGHAVGNDVLLHAGHAADHGAAPHPHELVHRRQTADHRVVLDVNVTAQGGVVRHDDAVADAAVVRHVRAHHEQAAIAHPGDHAAALGPRVHGRVLADDVAGADDQARGLAAILQVLRTVADRREGEYLATGPDLRAALHNHVAVQHHASRQRDIRPDDAVGSDAHVRSQVGRRVDDGGGMDVRHQSSMIMAEKVACAFSSPSAFASPRNFQTLPRWRSLVTWTRSVSPGKTGRRKRASSTVMK